MDKNFKKHILLALIAIIIVGSIVYLESIKVSPNRTSSTEGDINVEDIILDEDIINKRDKISLKSETLIKTTKERLAQKAIEYESAKEISTPDGFINIDTITVADLIGKKVILIDFWTYSCINCQRTLPFLNSWYEKYSDDGLVILGVHTPEFEFEKDYNNVLRAVEKFNVKYPVILDNDFSTWQAYKNRYWPRKYLIDIDGFIVYDHIGEGSYVETEAKIVELLNERSRVLGAKEVTLDMSQPTDIDVVDYRKVQTPELYLGSSRIEFIANLPSRDCFGIVCEFETLGGVALNTFQLEGSWIIDQESSILTGETGSIFIRFSANTVHLVAGSNSPVQAEIYLDGSLVTSLNGGAHVNNGITIFTTHDLYNLIDLQGNYGEHLLEIRFLDSGVSSFAFTFG